MFSGDNKGKNTVDKPVTPHQENDVEPVTRDTISKEKLMAQNEDARKIFEDIRSLREGVEALKGEDMDILFRGILKLQTVEDCYDFFEDLCTIAELRAMVQRFQVARMLDEGRIYSDIVQETGAYTATISRVNKCLVYGSDGYRKMLDRLKEDELSLIHILLYREQGRGRQDRRADPDQQAQPRTGGKSAPQHQKEAVRQHRSGKPLSLIHI